MELKLMINTRSLSNQALKSAHPSLLCCPLVALRNIQLMTGEPRPRYSALQLLGVSGACGWNNVWLRAKPVGCVELPRSLMRQQCPKWGYQFLFYYDETKSMMNKKILSMLKIVAKLSLGYSMVSCAHLGVRWPDCFSFARRVATTVMSQ